MKKVGLLLCGNSGVDYEELDYPYEIIRSKLIIDGKEYEDYIDIEAEAFYELIDANPDVELSTAQASTGEILMKLERLKKQGYEDIVAITISSALSGTYNNVRLAADLIKSVNVYVVDSRSVTFGQLAQVYKAIELIEQDYNGSQVFEYLEEYKKRIEVYVLVDTLKFLVKNGRLSVASGMIGSLLKIKPLLFINKLGQLVPFMKIRTFSKAKKKLIELAKKEIDGGIENFYLAYTNNKNLVLEIKEEILKYEPKLNVSVHPLTPVVGAHAGPGTCGFGVVRKEK